MKDISIRDVDVHLIISDICLIFRFPRLLMLISAAHLIFFLPFVHTGRCGLDTFQARFFPVALLLLTARSLKWENHLLLPLQNFDFKMYTSKKERKEKKQVNE